MKTLMILFLLVSELNAQTLTMKEVHAVLDQNAPILSKVEVGDQIMNDSYEMHPDCVIEEKNVLTIVELSADSALVLNEQINNNKCTGEQSNRRFLLKDKLVTLENFKSHLSKSFKGWTITRRDNIIDFLKKKGTESHLYQYNMNNNLFGNWAHWHHSYNGIEDHNLKFPLKKRTIVRTEYESLPVCEKDPQTMAISNCK